MRRDCGIEMSARRLSSDALDVRTPVPGLLAAGQDVLMPSGLATRVQLNYGPKPKSFLASLRVCFCCSALAALTLSA